MQKEIEMVLIEDEVNILELIEYHLMRDFLCDEVWDINFRKNMSI